VDDPETYKERLTYFLLSSVNVIISSSFASIHGPSYSLGHPSDIAT
jgi:hypothetical protein